MILKLIVLKKTKVTNLLVKMNFLTVYGKGVLIF